MQREIKFRVWSKRKNKMFHLAEDTIGQYGLEMNNHAWGMFDYDGGDGSCECNKAFDDVLMQYIGLQDKNGKEIYEGDILHADNYWDIVIEFENGSFVCKALDKVQYINNIINVPIGKFDNLIAYEVIGNIYENQNQEVE